MDDVIRMALGFITGFVIVWGIGELIHRRNRKKKYNAWCDKIDKMGE